MGVVIGKLKTLKSVVKFWNIEVSSNLDCNIQRGSTPFTKLQKQFYEDSFSEELLNLEFDVHADLNRLLHQ